MEKEKKPWRRRTGVIWRSPQLGIPREPRYGWFWQGVWENDGGEDAPLSRRGRLIFRSVLLGIFVAFVVFVPLTASGH